jgi:hypothetical protein
LKGEQPATTVEYSNLPVQIAALRRLLDEGRSGQSCIQTLPGRGYRFVDPVTLSATTNSRDGARPRLSIVVLPFSNVGKDPQQQYLADGITEDVTTDLSRIPDMTVISSTRRRCAIASMLWASTDRSSSVVAPLHRHTSASTPSPRVGAVSVRC